jgi:mycoredoxin-dependent peroxiredoxin
VSTSALPAPGEAAPDLTLPDTHGTPITLSALRGTPVCLVFLPFAFSGTCTFELRDLRDNHEDFEAAGVRVLGVTCDSVFTLRAWAEQEGLPFDLLSDFWPHGAVARAYGLLDEETGMARRGSVLVDADGIVRWSTLSPGGAARDVDAYRAALAAL